MAELYFTKHGLAREAKLDPRSRAIKDLQPVAHVVIGQTLLPLYAVDLVKQLTEQKN